MIEYKHVIDLFAAFPGARADRPLTTLQHTHIEDFKRQLSACVSPLTVNKALKDLKASFNNAVAKRQLEFKPAEHVKFIALEEAGGRSFTGEEIGNLLKAADPEWHVMILLIAQETQGSQPRH